MGIFKSKDKRISQLENELKKERKRVRQLERRCEEKDSYFLAMISDGMRHGSSLAARHMADRKKYLRGE